MLAAALALLVGALCVGSAFGRFRRLGMRPGGGGCGASGSQPLSARERLTRDAAALLGPSPGEQLVRDVLGAPSRAHAVAEMNERLSDAQSELAGAAVPRVAARIALGSGTLLAIVEVARGLGRGDVSVLWALGAFGCGLVAAGVAAHLGRLADSRARARREQWNALSRGLMRLLPSTEQAQADSQQRGPPARRLF